MNKKSSESVNRITPAVVELVKPGVIALKATVQRTEQMNRYKGENAMLQVHAKNLGTVTVLCLQGQIVTGETEILRNAVDSLSMIGTVILDLAQVTTLDAHGLGVLLELRERTHAKAIRFELMNVREPLRRVLEITRLDTVFRIRSGVEFLQSAKRDQQARGTLLRSCA